MNIDICTYRGRIGCFAAKIKKKVFNSSKFMPFCDYFYQFWLNIRPFCVICLQVLSSFVLSFILLWPFLIGVLYLCGEVVAPKLSYLKKRSNFSRSNFTNLRGFCVMFLIFYMVIEIDHAFLYLCGDVEKNPGPLQLKTNKLNFAVWNLDSLLCNLNPRIPHIESLDSINKFDLFGVCESYLNDTVIPNDLTIHGFSNPPFRADSPNANNNKQGGVCLYYKDYLPIKNRPELTTLNETIVCEIKLKSKKIFFILSYRSPSLSLAGDIDTYCNSLESTLNKIRKEKPSTIILTGDFNAKSTSFWEDEPTENLAGKKMSEFMLQNCLNELINEPTHFRNNPTCIDLIFTDRPTSFVSSGTFPSIIPSCHHNIIHGTLNFSVPSPPAYKRKLWFYDKANRPSIKEAFSLIDWQANFNGKNVNQMTEFFNSTVLDIMSKNIPNKTAIINDKDAPWITASIKNKIKRKYKVFKKWKITGEIVYKNKFKQMQSQINLLINDAKQSYHQEMCNKLCKPDNEHVFWTTFNRLTNNKKVTNIPPLEEDGNIISSFQEKAEIFNKYFADQCRPLSYEIPLPPLRYKTNARLDNIEITANQIVNLILKLNTKKATGPDDISANMLKLCAMEVSIPLKLIYNKCITEKVFPSAWKQANVQPVHKKKSRQLKTNYRPISLLPITSKIFEKLLFDATYKFLNDNDLISPNQSGFRPNDSTINQLLSITNEIYENYEDYSETRALFLDISKAFDKVWHDGLLFKLKINGISGNLLELLKNFLIERKQRVVLNGKTSEWKSLNSGVPQGSVLGPLLFLLYINDLTENINSRMKLFADDSSIFIKVNDVLETHETLEGDLATIKNWAHQWKMTFNPDITKQAIEVIFSWKKKKPIHPQIIFNDVPVLRQSSTKHLGLILDDRLTFKKHIEEKIKTANKGLGLLRYLKKYADRNVLEKIYKMYIRPHLDYGDVIYHGQTNEISNLTESVQYRAGLIVSGCWKGTNKLKLYHELGWESLYQRRHFRRLCLYFKIQNGLTPSFLYDCIKDIPATSTNRYLMSFYPYCKAYWDNLGEDLKLSPNLNSFKSKIIKQIRPPPKIVPFCKNKKLLSAFFRLRVGHSDLRDDRFRHNFNCNSPVCSCNTGNESVEHFLLRCPLYASHRCRLVLELLKLTGYSIITKPDTIWTKILLYGDNSFKHDTNLKILDETLTYIEKTRRFVKIEAYSN